MINIILFLLGYRFGHKKMDKYIKKKEEEKVENEKEV